CGAYLGDLIKTNSQFARLLRVSTAGAVNCDSSQFAPPMNIGNNVSLSRALRTKNFALGDYVARDITIEPSFPLAYPVLDSSKQLRAVLIASLRLDWLAMRFANIDIPVTGEMDVIDTNGTLLLRDPDSQNWVGKNISNTPLGLAMLGKLQGTGEFPG